MAIFTKNKKPDTRPRCEARNGSKNRCQNHGNAYRDTGLLSICVCSVHERASTVRHYKDIGK